MFVIPKPVIKGSAFHSFSRARAWREMSCENHIRLQGNPLGKGVWNGVGQLFHRDKQWIIHLG
jgi:hypothetical protein